MDNLVLDPKESWIVIRFSNPGSAVIDRMDFGTLYPQQLLVAATVLEMEGKQQIVNRRQQTALQIPKGGGIITPQ